MHRLFPEKHVTIITTDALEKRLVASVQNSGASGYTVVRARGAGSSGEQTGMLDVDTNIKFHIVIPEDRISVLLDDLEYLMQRGYHLIVFVSDVSVLAPEKFTDPMAED